MKTSKNSTSFNRKLLIDREYPKILSNISISEAIKALVNFRISKYLSKSIKNSLQNEGFLVDWFCYVCRDQIRINVKKVLEKNEFLKTSDYCCEKHKSEKINNTTSITWIKYENAFHVKLQKIIQSKNGITNRD